MAKKIKHWAGFVNGRIYRERCSDFDPSEHYFQLSIFTSKKVAKRKFQDVRPVEIKEIKPTRK